MGDTMTKAMAMLAAALLTVSGTALADGQRKAAKNGYHEQKIVYHINDAELAGPALRNVMNHLNALGDENTQVAVVTHGKGINFLLNDWKDSKGNSFDDTVHELANRGVKFQVCNNTLRGRNLGADKINMHAEIVPSGVATVAELQHQGYVYVKP